MPDGTGRLSRKCPLAESGSDRWTMPEGNDPVTKRAEVDVLVVGAGPTGLTLAGLLHAMGVTVRIIDRQLDRVRESRALAVQPRTLEVLRGLGLAQTLVERGNCASQLRLHADGRVVAVRLFDVGLEDTAYPFLLFVSQAETESVLNEHLAEQGVHVERGVEIVSFEAGEEAVLCILRHGDERTERLHARYLVGCDGAHSSVRHGAESRSKVALIRRRSPSATSRLTATSSATSACLPGRGRHALLLPARPAGDLANARDTPAGQRERPGTGRARPHRPAGDRRRLHRRQLRLRDPVWLTYFRPPPPPRRQLPRRPCLPGRRCRPRPQPGRRPGNEHRHPRSLEPGWKLALVAKGIADQVLLDTYETERRPIGRFVLRFTDRAATIATSESRILRLLRPSLCRGSHPSCCDPPGRERTATAPSASSASTTGAARRPKKENRRLRRGPKPGDRLPDARISRDGQAGWLHDAVAAPSFHLLLCGSADGWDSDRLAAMRERHDGLLVVHLLARRAAPGALHDLNGQAFARLGVEGAAQYLVRPDGHIGYRCRSTNLGGVDRYLARWLPGARLESGRSSRDAPTTSHN